MGNIDRIFTRTAIKCTVSVLEKYTIICFKAAKAMRVIPTMSPRRPSDLENFGPSSSLH